MQVGDIIYGSCVRQVQALPASSVCLPHRGADEIPYLDKTMKERRKEFERMCKFFGGVCVKCRGSSNLINVERDHIYPKRWGGTDNISNLQPLCARCNIKKDADTTDYRIIYAKEYSLKIPNRWLL